MLTAAQADHHEVTRSLLTTHNCSFTMAEPAGAASGVAYLMTLVLSSKSVDPKTLAPEGTVLNAKKVNKHHRRYFVGACCQLGWDVVVLHAASQYFTYIYLLGWE